MIDATKRYRSPGAAERARKRHQGTRLGYQARVALGWTEYRDTSGSSSPIEQHAREVHYDVLRREGFDPDRAREIAAQSSELQARELERWRGEGSVGPTPVRSAPQPSGFRIESILPAAITRDEG